MKGELPGLPLESPLSWDSSALLALVGTGGSPLTALSCSRWKLSSRELIRSWWRVRRNYPRCGSPGTRRSSSRAQRGTCRSKRYPLWGGVWGAWGPDFPFHTSAQRTCLERSTRLASLGLLSGLPSLVFYPWVWGLLLNLGHLTVMCLNLLSYVLKLL